MYFISVDRFTLPTFWSGYRKDLEVTDLYKPLKEHTSSYLGTKISRIWQKECEKKLSNEGKDSDDRKHSGKKKLKQPSLVKVLMKCFGVQLILYGLILAVSDIVFRYMIV